ASAAANRACGEKAFAANVPLLCNRIGILPFSFTVSEYDSGAASDAYMDGSVEWPTLASEIRAATRSDPQQAEAWDEVQKAHRRVRTFFGDLRVLCPECSTSGDHDARLKDYDRHYQNYWQDSNLQTQQQRKEDHNRQAAALKKQFDTYIAAWDQFIAACSSRTPPRTDPHAVSIGGGVR
ncbi:MAG: hypothetical protein AAB393_06065, partial [Bacteroidota bacterium]